MRAVFFYFLMVTCLANCRSIENTSTAKGQASSRNFSQMNKFLQNQPNRADSLEINIVGGMFKSNLKHMNEIVRVHFFVKGARSLKYDDYKVSPFGGAAIPIFVTEHDLIVTSHKQECVSRSIENHKVIGDYHSYSMKPQDSFKCSLDEIYVPECPKYMRCPIAEFRQLGVVISIGVRFYFKNGAKKPSEYDIDVYYPSSFLLGAKEQQPLVMQHKDKQLSSGRTWEYKMKFAISKKQRN